MTTTLKSMRDEFEAHMRSTTLSNCVRMTDGDYFNPHIQHQWDVWQAATEAAAKKCEELVYAIDNGGNAYKREASASRCADAIRGRDKEVL